MWAKFQERRQLDVALSRFVPPDWIELYELRQSGGSSLASLLEPPSVGEPLVERDGVELRWELPEQFDQIRAELAKHPLLTLGFRVYRWRAGERPALLGPELGASEAEFRTRFRDDQLPLWSERLFYTVATVLEGRIDGQATLIESKRSALITVQTPERFELQVVGGVADSAEIRLAAPWRDRRHEAGMTVTSGDRIQLRPTGTDAGAPLDTGLTVLEIAEIARTESGERERLLFEPDGRRSVDPVSGLPRTRLETVTETGRIVELRCRDASGTLRTYRSPPLR